MPNKYIPFGYEIADGEIQIIEEEAEIVRSIFSLYIQGGTLKSISERLNLTGFSYANDGRIWDKNIVKRILENKKYIGDNEYPAIMPIETYEMANQYKKQRGPKMNTATQKRLHAYRTVLCCRICGQKMQRQKAGSGEKRKMYWKCTNKNCDGYKHVMNEEKLMKAISELFQELANNPEKIDFEMQEAFCTNAEVISASNELNTMLQDATIDINIVIEKIQSFAERKFRLCKNEDNTIISQEIKKYMALYVHKEVHGTNIEKVIRRVEVDSDKTLHIELVNGKVFERRT